MALFMSIEYKKECFLGSCVGCFTRGALGGLTRGAALEHGLHCPPPDTRPSVGSVSPLLAPERAAKKKKEAGGY
jgi:hypothetical protein